MSDIFKTMNGNEAAAYVSYAFSEAAAIYPITPSTDMAEYVDEWSANGKKNIFGQEVIVKELQSEGGAAGAVHGALVAGSLTSTYTASQGLLLMIPNMYKIAGERLPAVFHVAARALASHALSIFGDHQDVMATRQTGFAMLSSNSVQEAMDLGAVAHLAAIKASMPFLHFFDGFRTSNEYQKIETISYDDLSKVADYDAINNFKAKALNPNNPKTMGTAQNPDIYFQVVESSNQFYVDVIDTVEECMNQISDLTGRNYRLFNYYGAEDADRVIVAMGSVCETAEEVVDSLNAQGEKVGLIKVRLYRPFSKKHFLEAMPKTVKKISVLDRTKEKGSIGEPLYLDVRNIYYDEEEKPTIVGGRYGLASKDTTPAQVKAVFDNLKEDKPKNDFTIGIVDDVTNKSLDVIEDFHISDEDTIRCKFWGFGSDGTVGANQQAVKIIGDTTDMYAQAYFEYDSKKSGGVTTSHLRFGKNPIRSTYLIDQADFISCSTQQYVFDFDLIKGLKKNGIFLLNTIWSPKEVDEKLPASLKNYIANENIHFYTINASQIASDIGLGSRTNMIMQSAFFKLSEVLPLDLAVDELKKSIVKAYGHKGEDIVNMNYQAVEQGIESLVKIEIPEIWKTAKDESKEEDLPEFIKDIVQPINEKKGNELPVSAFLGIENGEFENGTSQFDKRGIALKCPEWNIDNCIQCNQCAYVCPHAVIRPFLINEEERANAPESFESKKAIGKGTEGLEYRIQISPLDCTGCGNCANTCPAKEKALVMKPFEEQVEKEKDNWIYASENISYKDDLFKVESVKGSQFRQPLLEFSGACAGCGETPYVKLITQLFGDRMMIANATGCSSIWGASAPSTPYCKNADGKGPAWANSLFEDNAEYGYGFAIAAAANRNRIKSLMEEFLALEIDSAYNEAFKIWIEGIRDVKASKEAAAMILTNKDEEISDERASAIIEEIMTLESFLIKQSIWVIGGDGWAYDIGFGGLDHVIASGVDINILVLDTEVYSNTGGQSSKATPTAAIAKFAAGGKRVRKKDLGRIAQTYGYVYTAQIALGANMNQSIKSLVDAESYDGPSLVIAYAPCINHGIKGGLSNTPLRQKEAVESGYWHLYTFDPRRADLGENPFTLDSKEPTKDFQDFIGQEVRYTSLKKQFPEVADELFVKAEEDARERYEVYKQLAETDE